MIDGTVELIKQFKKTVSLKNLKIRYDALMLTIHTSNQLEQLKQQYAELIKNPLTEVFKPETVVVQNAGMARWLSMQMAQESGISANTEFLFPAEFMWRLLRLVSPDIPEHSQCAPDSLRFHIYTELMDHVDDYPELHHYLFKQPVDPAIDAKKSIIDPVSAWDLSCQTAQLLDQYLFYRSDWINAWETQHPSENSEHWQARLWKRCVTDKGLLHWLKLQHQFSRNFESLDTSLLEERISFFSMSALSPGYIDLLEDVSKKTDIHIFIINPCGDIYWGDIQSEKSQAKLDPIAQQYTEVGNPLLASLGKQGRDFIDKLISIQDQQTSEEHQITASEELDSNTLLSQIQQDIYHLQQPILNPTIDLTDDSLQFHSCHTAMREVEVLYDQILAQLDADENLVPSDIVVMMPDIEKYAPYIESVFSTRISAHSKQSLPFSIADRDPQNIFKLVQALNKLFCLADTRFDVEAVFELLEYEDLRQHFGFTQEQVEYCRELALASNIRWGISDSYRQQHDLPNTEEHTWKYNLDRMLVGYALSDFETADGIESGNQHPLFESNRNLKLLPYNEIEGSKVLVLAKLKKFTDSLFSINKWQHQSHSLETWFSKTKKLLQQLAPDNEDQQRILKSFADTQVKASLADFEQVLPFSLFTKILQQNLSEITAKEKYLGYGITFCALVPMRSVPFKIVALMGMNDGEFPRQDSRPSFDLMVNKARRGDRSRRDEDRYLFLESLLAARKKLIISYIGQSTKDNSEVAPSVLVSELLDTLTINSGKQANTWIVKHPLQAFSPRYFQTQQDADLSLFSYASQYLNLKSIEQGKKPDHSSNDQFITTPLDVLDDEYKKLDLDDLIRFYQNPSRVFLKSRFGIQSYNDDKELQIREPFEIEFFKQRDIRKLLLETCSDESNKQTIARAKGLLPYGEIGDAIYAKEKQTMDDFEQQLPKLDQRPIQHVSLIIGDFQLTANIDQLSDSGRFVKHLSEPYATDYIELWLTHLCLNAAINLSQTASTIDLKVAQTQFYSPATSFLLNPVENAEPQLKVLLDHYWNGLHFPLAFFPKSSFALYSKTGKANISDMSGKWNGNGLSAAEKDAFEHHLLHRNLEMDKDQQSEEFMKISEEVFGNMFRALTEL